MITMARHRLGCLCSLVLLSLCISIHRPALAQSANGDGIAVLGDESDRIEFGAGAFNIQSHGHGTTGPTGEGLVQLEGGRKWLYVGPVVGLMVNAKGGGMAYGGGYADIAIGRILLTPMAAAGAYSHGGELNMGGVFQFRLGATGAYQFDGGSRLGVAFVHVSNANLDYRNPGENELMLTYAVPIDLGL